MVTRKTSDVARGLCFIHSLLARPPFERVTRTREVVNGHHDWKNSKGSLSQRRPKQDKISKKEKISTSNNNSYMKDEDSEVAIPYDNYKRGEILAEVESEKKLKEVKYS